MDIEIKSVDCIYSTYTADESASVIEPVGDCTLLKLEFENIRINDGFFGGDISRSVGKVKQFRSKVIFRSPRSISLKSSSTAVNSPMNEIKKMTSITLEVPVKTVADKSLFIFLFLFSEKIRLHFTCELFADISINEMNAICYNFAWHFLGSTSL